MTQLLRLAVLRPRRDAVGAERCHFGEDEFWPLGRRRASWLTGPSGPTREDDRGPRRGVEPRRADPDAGADRRSRVGGRPSGLLPDEPGYGRGAQHRRRAGPGECSPRSPRSWGRRALQRPRATSPVRWEWRSRSANSRRKRKPRCRSVRVAARPERGSLTGRGAVDRCHARRLLVWYPPGEEERDHREQRQEREGRAESVQARLPVVI